MSTHITLRQIEYFLSVADTGQISKSANLCAVSQSSMTIALKNLEDAVGVPLLQRHAKGVLLTAAGERFLLHAQHATMSIDCAIAAAQQEPEHIKGHVRIGMTEVISTYLMPSLLSAITQRFRNLTVEIVEDSHEAIENALNDGRVDIALLLVSNYTEDSGLKYETILRFARKLWTRPDHALQDIQQVKLEDIAHENYLLLDMDGHVQIVNKYWHECGLTPNVWMKSKSIEAIRSLVSLGQGVTILSDLVYRPWSLEGNRISRRDLSSPVPTMDVGVVWRRSGTMSMPCRELVELLRSWKKTMPGPKSVNLP